MNERTTWADWTDDQGRPWEIVGKWRLTNEGAFVLTGIEVHSPEGHRLTRQVLVSVPLEPDVFAHLDILPAWIDADGQPHPVEVAPPVKGRPKLYGPDHYRQVADVYRLAENHGRPPRRAVMQQFSLPERTAARHIAEARRLGLLPPKEN